MRYQFFGFAFCLAHEDGFFSILDKLPIHISLCFFIRLQFDQFLFLSLLILLFTKNKS